MPTPFQLDLVTPERILFSGTAEEVAMRTDEGEIAFLAHHEDFIGALDITVLAITAPNESEQSLEIEAPTLNVAVHGGFVQVTDQGVTILAAVAELAAEIDVDRARRALALSEERLQSQGPTEISRTPGEEASLEHPRGAVLALLASDSPEAAIARAKARLHAAGAPAMS
jgi:F-type H+-transporting ATPase subunit epsilon